MDLDNLNYRYFNEAGVPFAGETPLFNRQEYNSQTTTCRIARSAIFKANDPLDKKAGRTLEEILTRNAMGEFQVIYMREYNSGVGKNKGGEPNVYLHVIWYEQFDILTSKVAEFLQDGIKNRNDHSATSDREPGAVEDPVGPSTATSGVEHQERGSDGAGGWGSTGRLEGGPEAEPRAGQQQNDSHRWVGRRRVVCTVEETKHATQTRTIADLLRAAGNIILDAVVDAEDSERYGEPGPTSDQLH